MSVVTYLVDKPQALAIIFALVLLGMFLGFLPSTLSENQEAMLYNQRQIIANQELVKITTEARYNGLQEQLRVANAAQATQNEKMIQIMRGMCLIIAKQSANTESLSLCNP